MTKTDLPYILQHCYWPETCWRPGKLPENLWGKQICHIIVLVTWELLVIAGDYAKSYDENRSAHGSAIQYCWWPGTSWWLREIMRKIMTKTDLPYTISAGDMRPAGDCGKLCEKLWRKQICHILLRISAGDMRRAGDCGKLCEKLWRKQICHTILLTTWDLLVTEEIIGKARPKTDLPYNTAGDLGPAIWPVWRFSRFSTICAKIHMLNLIINKVTVWMTKLLIVKLGPYRKYQ